jgi:hypothetical protein
MKLDWNSQLYFGDGIASYIRPQADGECQGDQLKSDVVEEETPHDVHC